MTDKPEPCGCWVEFPGLQPVIIYCPTHAAAFEYKADMVEAREYGDRWRAKANEVNEQSADLLAALKEIDRYEFDKPKAPQWQVDEFIGMCKRVARAAIAKTEGEVKNDCCPDRTCDSC